MRLHYFSSGPRERVLEAIVAAGHQVPGIYVTDPARWPKVCATISKAAELEIPVRIVSRAELPRLGQELAGEACLSAGFGFLFPPAFLSAVAACLNVHGTLLPAYAGARTLNWVIECGERISGVTVHLVDEGVDTGPILLQRSFPLSIFETGRSLARKTLEFEPSVVVEALDRYQREGERALQPQPSGRARRFAHRRPEHSLLDPGRPLIELYDKIRAADPDAYPAHFFVEGQKVCIRMWRPERPDGEQDMV